MKKTDEDYGCRDWNDDDSIISERCWIENHRNDSRKWLTRDGHKKAPPHRIYSTMRETYPAPEEENIQTVGKRRQILIEKCYAESAQEITDERNKPPPVEEYCTEYDGNFHKYGFTPLTEDERYRMFPELYQKYPLYGSSTASYWDQRVKRMSAEPSALRGFTKVTDSKNPFKRNSIFSTPITEATDCEIR